MSAILLLVLRLLIVAVLYAFLGWVLLTLQRDLKRQGELIAARRPTHLTLAIEGGAARAFTLPEVLVGRAPGCELVLNDDTVSAQHARFIYRQGQWWVEDLHSTNGTTLHDQLIQVAAVVAKGDQILFGNVRVKII